MTLGQWICAATARLREAGVDSPRLSAEILLAHVTGTDRVSLATWPDRGLSPEHQSTLAALLARREQGEPVAYLTGCKEFFGRDFTVTRDTLIPRPETELLVEAALAAFSAAEPILFADFGTGSGCLAVTLCAERPAWRGIAVDASFKALRVARANARRHGVRNLDFVCADFTRPLLPDAALLLLVSNPPYVSDAEYVTLSREVRDFEPPTALVPRIGASPPNRAPAYAVGTSTHADGLEHASGVIRTAERVLCPGGVLLMEHGWTQGSALRVCLENNNWCNKMICKDLSGLDRYIRAERTRWTGAGVE